jgi:NADH-quinone oxidoreductase subunit M
LRWSERVPALLLLGLLLFIGFWPRSLSAPLNSALGSLVPALAVKAAADPRP